MTDKIVILVTAANARECRKIARYLVEAKLAACVNITPPVRSVYRWQGKVADEKEVLMLIKSTRGLFSEVQAAITRLHSYQTPEIIALPIIDGSENYLAWLGDSVKQTREISLDNRSETV